MDCTTLRGMKVIKTHRAVFMSTMLAAGKGVQSALAMARVLRAAGEVDDKVCEGLEQASNGWYTAAQGMEVGE